MNPGRAETDFRTFLLRAAAELSLTPYQELPQISVEEARQKALEVINIFKQHDLRLRFPDQNPDKAEQDFNTFYRELFNLLPPGDFKRNVIRHGSFSAEDVISLYIAARDYLATQRALVIYKGCHIHGWNQGSTKRTCYYYWLSDQVYYIEEVGHLGVPIVKRLLGNEHLTEAILGRSSNGTPYILSESVTERIAFLQRPEEEAREAFSKAAFSRTLLSAMWASISRLLGMKRDASGQLRAAEVAYEAKRSIAEHEHQHKVDFLDRTEGEVVARLAQRKAERRTELRASIVQLRNAPWDALLELCLIFGRRNDGELPQQAKVLHELTGMIIRLIDDNRQLFEGIIAPAKQAGVSMEDNIAGQLYKFARPESEDELRVLTGKLCEEFRFFDLVERFKKEGRRSAASAAAARRSGGCVRVTPSARRNNQCSRA